MVEFYTLFRNCNIEELGNIKILIRFLSAFIAAYNMKTHAIILACFVTPVMLNLL